MRYIFFCALVAAITACGGKGYEYAESAQDAGREFIRASLDGDHKKARFYLLKDTTNLLLIQRQQRDYEHLTSEEKQQHLESSIRPVDITDVNDSTTVYRYYNTYNPKDTTSITIVKSMGEWVVDLKSIFKK